MEYLLQVLTDTMAVLPRFNPVRSDPDMLQNAVSSGKNCDRIRIQSSACKLRKWIGEGTSAGHITNTFPDAFEVFLPQSHFTIPTAYGENVACERPRDSPDNVRELAWGHSCASRSSAGCRWVQRSLDPCGSRCIFSPNQYCLVLYHVRLTSGCRL
jgi:hypothetical protein